MNNAIVFMEQFTELLFHICASCILVMFSLGVIAVIIYGILDFLGFFKMKG